MDLIKKVYHLIPGDKRHMIRMRGERVYWLFIAIRRKFFIFYVERFARSVRNFNFFEKKVYSQNGEDGIIDYIYRLIGTTNKFCVEFGVGDGSECNTRFLIKKRGWNFLQMDSRKNFSSDISQEFITAENINDILRKYNVPDEFDLLSIDIDLNDYWVWKSLDIFYKPRLVVIEYNSSILPGESKVVEYVASGEWDGTNYFGASLLALSSLAATKGYTLVACDSIGVNAFFVRNDCLSPLLPLRSIIEIYRPPRFGIKKHAKYHAHLPASKCMINV